MTAATEPDVHFLPNFRHRKFIKHGTVIRKDDDIYLRWASTSLSDGPSSSTLLTIPSTLASTPDKAADTSQKSLSPPRLWRLWQKAPADTHDWQWKAARRRPHARQGRSSRGGDSTLEPPTVEAEETQATQLAEETNVLEEEAEAASEAEAAAQETSRPRSNPRRYSGMASS